MNNFCNNCGNPITSGKFCTNCGAPISTTNILANTGHLSIKRKGQIMGFAVNVHVKINEVPYELGAGQKIDLDLAPGTYRITYKIWCRREKEVIINIVAGNNYLIDLVYDPLWGGFKLGANSKLQ